MGNLLLNENMKIYRRARTWVMIGLMIGGVLLGSFVEWYYDGRDASEATWQEQAASEKQRYLELLAEPELDAEDRTFFQDRISILDYRLAHDVRPEDGTMWEGILGSAELMVLITLFTVIVAGDSLAGEFSAGTIKLLLIRPASRLKILVSKYLSLIVFGLLLLAILFLVSVVANGLIYRFQAVNLPLLTVDAEGVVVEKSMMATLWQTYLLNGVSTILFVTMAFMISAAFRSSAMAIGISIFALFAGAAMLELLQAYEWSKYLLFANIDLTQYLGGRPYREGMTLPFSISVLVGYFLLFNLIAWQVFTRRDVAA
ncbi:ABC transporter permease [Paenibacillus antri]|uniref:ABC transporter permease n=1 Tax=Paenibacillus antri TaxID=2582848 RepID=A0A5R9FY83_9BACL|nr:ABC transporter permease [Paenibacillus antri]TLS48451.1 ABC transporter permease [Paenibacillus antri]